MNKAERQDLIKNMIQEEKIGRQADIQRNLEERGIFVTQTTLSRDLREIGLVKVYENGKSFYALAEEEGEGLTGPWRSASLYSADAAA